jgi:hypothetical protein
MSGFINYIDVKNNNKNIRIVKGKKKNINVIYMSKDRKEIYKG